MELKGKDLKVLVTGGTGFIGARLIEALVVKRGVQVVAAVRDFSKVARIARLGVKLARTDFWKPDAFEGLLRGIDVVFHCAFAPLNDAVKMRSVNLEATLALARLAKQEGVKRFVHFSSMAVYGQELPPQVNEQTPYRPTTGYGRAKCDVELAVREFGRTSGLSVVTVQPTKVYGPYDYNFTVPLVKKLLDGKLWLIEGGSGLVSPGYVDNVVDGTLLSAEVDGAGGGVFILADGPSLQWSEFYEYFAAMCQMRPYGTITRQECEPVWQAHSRKPSYRSLLASTFLSKEARAAYPTYRFFRLLRRACPERLVRRLKTQFPSALEKTEINTSEVLEPPSPYEYRDYMRCGAFSTEHAQRVLGYNPKVRITEGMARVEAWLRYARILPDAVEATRSPD